MSASQPASQPIVVDLKTKLKQRRNIMKQLRGNQCTATTLEHAANTVPPNMQLAVARQAATTKKTKPPATKKPSRPRKKASDTKSQANVSQSTADTQESIQLARKDIFQQLFQQKLNELAKTLPLELANELQSTSVQSLLSDPDVGAALQDQAMKWLQGGPVPDPSTLEKCLQDLVHATLQSKQQPFSKIKKSYNHDLAGL